MPDPRRFRRELACGDVVYLTTTTGDYPIETDRVWCMEHGSQPALATVEVPAIRPRLDCFCKKEASAIVVRNARTDHPSIEYRCPDEHTFTVNL